MSGGTWSIARADAVTSAPGTGAPPPSASTHVVRSVPVGAEALEALELLDEHRVVSVRRQRERTDARVPEAHRADPVVRVLRQRAIEGVGQVRRREPRRDTQGEREHRHRGEAGILEHHARAEADVDPREADLVHPAQAPGRTRLLPVCLDVPELAVRLPRCVFRSHAPTLEVFRAHLDVNAELLPHLVLDPAPITHTGPERPESGGKPDGAMVGDRARSRTGLLRLGRPARPPSRRTGVSSPALLPGSVPDPCR